MSNRLKIVIIVIVVLALAILGLVYATAPKTQIKLAVAPSEVNIQIDSTPIKRVSNTATLSLAPGKHHINVSEDQFTNYETDITVKKGETQEFLVALTPTTAAAQERLNNPTSQDIVQRFHGKSLTTQTNKLDSDYPLLNALPIEARLYRIYPCSSQKYPDDKTKIAVCVDSDVDTPTIQPYVEKDITSRGYKVSDYEIIYTSDIDAGEE